MGKWDHLDCIECPVFVLEPDSAGVPRYVSMNRFGCNELGIPQHVFIGKTAQEAIQGDHGRLAYDQHVAVFHSGMPTSYQYVFAVDQTRRLLRIHLTPQFDAQGAVLRVFGTVTDLSGAQLLDNIQLGMAAIKSEIADFISLSAFETNAPLQSVSSVAARLRDGFQDLGDGKIELIGLLETIGDKAMSLIADTLAFAQFSTPGVSAHASFEFYDLVNEILLLVDPWERCHATCDKALVRGDRMVMQMVLRILVETAQNTHRERLRDDTLSFDFRAWHSEEETLHIAFADNAGGLARSEQDVLKGGRLEQGSSHGLMGLRRLLHARGGRLCVNKQGAGSEIEVQLPGRVLAHEESHIELR